MLATVSNSVSTVVLLLVLAVAVGTDLRAHRIPNWLSAGTILAGLSLQFGFLGLDGLGSGLLGLALAFALMIPFYMARGMGAGDVKLMMGIGTFLGPWDTAIAIGFTLLCGTVAGIAILAWRKGMREWLSRYWLMLRTLGRTWKPIYVPPGTEAVAAQRFPYAAAIAAGTTVALWWLLQLEPLVYLLNSWVRG